MTKPKAAPAVPARTPPPRSAKEAPAPGETPEQTVTRFFRQLHRQVGLPFFDADAKQLNAALAALRSPSAPAKEPQALEKGHDAPQGAA